MRKVSKIAALAAVAFMSTTAIADHHAGDKKDKMNAGAAAPPAHWGLVPSGVIMPWGIGGPYNPWSIFDPYLLDIPGGDGKGMPVYDANDATKIIGYVKMPARPKPTGPVHCMIKETGLLAKSVDDCEAAGGSVAK